jgi:hypothetical protein
MTAWIRRHPYTIATVCVLAAIVAWFALTGQPWTHYLYVALFTGASAAGTFPRTGHRKPPEWPSWQPRGPSLPCPPGCRIQVEHRHDRLHRQPSGRC